MGYYKRQQYRKRSEATEQETVIQWCGWEERKVEIYELDYKNGIPKYYLWKTITDENSRELKIIHFPNVKITFEELFDEIEP